jgi:DNA-directed RNA polymerase subunit L
VVPKQVAIASKLVDIVAYNITWKTNDRAIFTFKNSQEIVDNKELLLKFIAKWLEHI